MCAGRQIARQYLDALSQVDEIELPIDPDNRIHSWHLFPIRLRLEKLSIDRVAFIEALRKDGVGTSVHWRPLHLHPYYESTFGWCPEHCPVATREWQRLVSLPIFPSMSKAELNHVVQAVTRIAQLHRSKQ